MLLMAGWSPDLPAAEPPRSHPLVYLAQRYLDHENPALPIEIEQQLLALAKQ